MARLYAHAVHYYTHFGERQQEYVLPAGEWREVPDDVADILCAVHPQKFVRLQPNENRPGEASLPGMASVEGPPEPERESEPEPEPEPAEAAPEPVKAGPVEKPPKYSWLKKREPKRGK